MARQAVLDQIQKYVHPVPRHQRQGPSTEGLRSRRYARSEDGQGRGGRTPPTRNRVARRGSRTCSTLRTAGLYCSFSKLWTQLARTARSSMSCRGLTHRDARSSRSSNPRRKTSTTTSCEGATRGAFQKGDGSASSTGRTMEEVLVVRVHDEILKRAAASPAAR